ncbi:hypothetical protein ACH5RR_033676 [Cinchona calisaya]|uniref:Transposase n=1 Tax=Cinchona calisaya TaxID=153742 RepID=A0ABD2YC89_9GENT
MPTSRKDEMINMVKERFDVPPGIDDWMLKSISKKCRSWKSRIKTKYFDPNVSFERRIHNRPTRVLENQWKGILSHWDSEEAKVYTIVDFFIYFFLITFPFLDSL